MTNLAQLLFLATGAFTNAPTPLSVAGPDDDAFVNWETPHVSPLDMTPDGDWLLAVNTADNRLEVFSVRAEGLVHRGAVPVGLDPVSVRARSNTEAWVVNHISDSISIVDLVSMRVTATLHTGDEPADVVFAGMPERAFVTVSQQNEVKVFDTSDLSLAPTTLVIEGEDPRALATDGTNVYVAIFESGTRTTIVSESAVSFGPWNPYAGDPNPPPNSGAAFSPPMSAGLPPPPTQSLIVKKDAAGLWFDDNGGDWSTAVSWDLHDHDVAIIDANTLTIGYAPWTMNLNMAIAIQPGVGATVVGAGAFNEVRYEPNLNGVFTRIVAAQVSPTGVVTRRVDMNSHLDYSTPTIVQASRDLAVGDPRGIDWNAVGNRAYVSGMGSNNLIIMNGNLVRIGRIEVGEGPTGVRLDENRQRVYVLNKFEGTVSIVDTLGLTESARVSFYDPTPGAISEGRPFLYDTHLTSGLGFTSCASCHIDGRTDQLSWDLGDPSGSMKVFNQICNDARGSDCEDWHPVKGPMATQTLIGIAGTEPFHWRGDREDLAAFNGAFMSLLGDDTQLTPTEMAQFEAFVETLTPPPNPFRSIDNSLPTAFSNGGNAQTGETLFHTGMLGGAFNCVECHNLPLSTNNLITANEIELRTQSINTPQLLNMYEKTGFSMVSSNNNRGFGYEPDGSVDTIFNFFETGFTFSNDQEKLDVEAFVMSLSTITHAGVGVQATIPNPATQPWSVQDLVAQAATGAVGLVAKGVIAGEPRGFYFVRPSEFRSDRRGEPRIGVDALIALAGVGSELTFTLVPAGSEVRIGVDRDCDGRFDRDELDSGSDPADPSSKPKIRRADLEPEHLPTLDGDQPPNRSSVRHGTTPGQD